MFNKLQIIYTLVISVLFSVVGFTETNKIFAAYFKPVKINYFLDEPIAVSLTIINQYTNTMHVFDNIKTEFKFYPEGGVTGKVSVLPRRMVGRIIPLSPKEQLKKVFYINESLKFDKPGKYCVDCTFTIEGRDPSVKLLQSAQDISVQEVQDYLTGKRKGPKKGDPGFYLASPPGSASSMISERVAGMISFALAKASSEQLSNVYNKLLQRSRNTDPKNKEDAIEAVWALCSVRNPLVVPYLIKAMMIPDYQIQESTVRSLAEIGTPEAIRALTDLDLKNQKAMFLRQFAAENFGRMKMKENIPFLIKLLDDDIESVQITAIQALGQIGAPEGLEAIRQKMPSFKGRVKDAAVKVLQKSSQAKEGVLQQTLPR